MRKFLIVTTLLASTILSRNPASAQALFPGSFVVDAYYGFPNLTTSILRTTYANSNSAADIELKGLGPMGVRAEYLLSSVFGLGIEANYISSGVSFADSGFTYDISVNRIRVFPRFNFHFVQSSEFLDAYATIGVGYHNATYKFTTTDPNFNSESVSGWWPVAFRMGVGFRAFFAGPLGLGMEFGLGGGALLSGGLALRLGYLG